MDVGIEVAGTHGEPELDVSITRRVPAIGFVLLVAALVCASVSGGALKHQDPAGPFLKCFWRALSTLLCCVPWLLHTRLHDASAFAIFRDSELYLASLLAGAYCMTGKYSSKSVSQNCFKKGLGTRPRIDLMLECVQEQDDSDATIG